MTEPNPVEPTMTLANLQELPASNRDPIKDFYDSIGVVNSPASGLQGS